MQVTKRAEHTRALGSGLESSGLPHLALPCTPQLVRARLLVWSGAGDLMPRIGIGIGIGNGTGMDSYTGDSVYRIIHPVLLRKTER